MVLAAECYVWRGGMWEKIGISEALPIRSEYLMRCYESHGRIRAYRLADNGMRVHFEHRAAHSGRRLSTGYSGTDSLHPDAIPINPIYPATGFVAPHARPRSCAAREGLGTGDRQRMDATGVLLLRNRPALRSADHGRYWGRNRTGVCHTHSQSGQYVPLRHGLVIFSADAELELFATYCEGARDTY